MRILIVSQYFWPENFRINELATELADRGHEVVVLTGQPNYPRPELFEEQRRQPARWSTFGRVTIVRVPLILRRTGALGLIANYLSFAATASTIGAWKLRNQAVDVILVYQPSPVTVGLPAVLLRRLKGAPVLFWVQDIWPDTLATMGVLRSRLALSAADRLVSLLYSGCDHLLAQSKAFVPRLAQQAPAARISYLPNWAERSGPAVSSTRAASAKASDRFDIFYLGNIGEAQDFAAVLDAVELLRSHRHIHWTLVGDGRAASWVRDEIVRRHLSSSVSMLGAFPPEQMPEFHRRADALLVCLKADPLFATTVPSKVQSYLAAGLPVVAMLDGEGARVIRESGSGLVCPAGDGRALARAVTELSMTTPAARKCMGAAGLAYSRAEFDFVTLVDRLESWFVEATGEANR